MFQTVQKLAVHHTAGANGETGDVAKATIRSIYYYHSVTQGWGDIGYSFLVDAAGVVYKGRSTSSTKTDADVTGENASAQGVTAGHAFGYNSGSVGIALLGNFVETLPSQAAQDTLRALLVSRAGAHGLHPAKRSLYTNPLKGSQAVFGNVRCRTTSLSARERPSWTRSSDPCARRWWSPPARTTPSRRPMPRP